MIIEVLTSPAKHMGQLAARESSRFVVAFININFFAGHMYTVVPGGGEYVKIDSNFFF